MIRSRQNQRLKDIRRLSRSKDERATRVLLEGPHLIEAALEQALPLESVLATAELMAREPDLVARLPRPPIEVEPRLLDEIADADSPRGIVAIAHLPRGGPSSLPALGGAIYVFAEAVQDPKNLGALARSSEAGGAAGLALSPGCTDPNHPRALRASAGSLLRLPVAIDVEPDDLCAHLSTANAGTSRWLGLVARGGDDLYDPRDQITTAAPTILAVGAEGHGLSADLLDRLDQRLTIALDGAVESLNVAVAAAIALFELRRRRRQARA